MKEVHLPPQLRGGIQFECQGSGKCCVSHGEYGSVYLTEEDIKRFTKTLGLKKKDILAQYTREKEGFTLLLDNPKSKACIFLKDRRCSVYESRPSQCRTWPFWPSVMKPRAWKKSVTEFCPGIGKGRHYTAEEILTIANQDGQSENQLRLENKLVKARK